MGVRSIKLKLIVPRGEGGESAAKRGALWATHRFINSAVRTYEELLLEMRQGDVLTVDSQGDEVVIPGDEWKQKLLGRLRGRGVAEEAATEALPLFRTLYEAIVKSSVTKGQGQGQDGRRYHSPLVSSASSAGDAVAAKRAMWRPLLPHCEEPAKKWVEKWANEARKIMKGCGNKLPASATRRGKWELQFLDDPEGDEWIKSLQSFLKEWKKDQSTDAIARLKELEALPIMESLTHTMLVGKRSGELSTYERSAFALAIEHLNSWESWGHIAREQYQSRLAATQRWRDSFLNSHKEALEHIRAWEQVYSDELRKVSGLATDQTVYRLGPRALRGWDRLQPWLKANPGASEEQRTEQVHILQAELGREFGSEQILCWVAHPDQQWLVDHPAGDVVSRIAKYNVLERRLEETRLYPLFTFADARMHPRFAVFDPPQNNNNPPFRLNQERSKRPLELEISLLEPVGDRFQQQRFNFTLAPSRQIEDAKLSCKAVGKTKFLLLERNTQDRRGRVSGKIGGSHLLFERSSLEKSADKFGSVWLKMSVEVGEDVAADLKKRNKERGWFSSNLSKRKAGERPPVGFRVMGVNLGLRVSACAAIYTVIGYDAEGIPIAKYDRPVVLALPGERRVPKEALENRSQLRKELAQVRAGIRHLQKICRVCLAVESADRVKEIGELQNQLSAGSNYPRIGESECGRLLALSDLPTAAWQREVRLSYDRVELELSLFISKWRKNSHGGHEVVGGKSVWTLDYLEGVRKTLISWKLHQRPWHDEVRRMDRDKMGTIGDRLLQHIQHLKEDRTKTTADMIVQAARGFVYREGTWCRRHEPVDLIVMEDLARYRFKTDRPKHENRRLMEWSHRQVVQLVEMQAEEAGIATTLAPPAFISQFDAHTGSPGIRCRELSASDVASIRNDKNHWLNKEITRSKIDLDREALQPGDLLPLEGGELFVSVNPLGRSGKVQTSHVDVNAARNLVQRYLRAQDPAFRLVGYAVPSKTQDRTYLIHAGKRIEGIYKSGLILLSAAPDEDAYTLQTFRSVDALRKVANVSKADLAKAGQQETSAEDEEDDELRNAEELCDKMSNDRLVFFRDPSGILCDGQWTDSKMFWREVRNTAMEKLSDLGRLNGF